MMPTRRMSARLPFLLGSLALPLALPLGLMKAADSDASARAATVARPAVFTLHVPPGAIVRFDGRDTDQQGLSRRFVTAPLVPGREYSYELSVTWIEGASAVERKRHVTFWAGEHLTLDFGPAIRATNVSDLYEDPAAPKPWGTSYYDNPLNAPDYSPAPLLRPAQSQRSPHADIVVRVPADAEVLFDDEPTTQKGTERHFLTPSLRAGKIYHYQVVARWKQGDKMVHQARSVEVRAGTTVEVNFLASAATKAKGR